MRLKDTRARRMLAMGLICLFLLIVAIAFTLAVLRHKSVGIAMMSMAAARGVLALGMPLAAVCAVLLPTLLEQGGVRLSDPLRLALLIAGGLSLAAALGLNLWSLLDHRNPAARGLLLLRNGLLLNPTFFALPALLIALGAAKRDTPQDRQ